jgi:uncharacterized repeat protein (TIGR02543 family)
MKTLFNKNMVQLLILSLVLCTVNVPAEVGSNWIEQWGIRWTFDKNISLTSGSGIYQYGQFANGDYWIVGPVTIISITPQSKVTTATDTDRNGRAFGAGITIHGSMVNITPGSAHGYCSNVGGWNAALNVALGVSASSPLVLPAGRSLVSTESKMPLAPDYSYIQKAAVLTVLAQAPAAGSFRPPYCGTDKTIRFNKSQLDYSKLASLTPVAGMPSLASVEATFEKVWLDHKGSYEGRYLHPYENMPNYGCDMAERIGIAGMMLNLRHSADPVTNNALKEKLLISFVQYGIDLWGVYKAGGTDIWKMDGGHGPGRKLPILMAGTLLGDQEMADIGKHNISDPFFGEDHTTYYLYREEVQRWIGSDGKYPPENEGRDDPASYYIESDYASIDLRNKSIPAWTSGMDYTQDTLVLRNNVYYSCKARHTSSSTTEPALGSSWQTYWRALESHYLGIPEFGKWYEGGAPLGVYQGRWITRGNQTWSYRDIWGWPLDGIVMTVHIMGLKSAWNHDALFDYMDRYVAWLGGQDTFIKNMWDTYRANYGPIWPNTESQPTTYTLSITSPNGSVIKSPNQTSYTAGTTVTLTAVPNAGYTFSGWSGDASGTANPVVIIMNSNKSVTAAFTQTQSTYTLTVSASNGSVARSPSKTSYIVGESVTLTAVPNSGYAFSNWSGDASGSNNPLTVTMNANKTIAAVFTQYVAAPSIIELLSGAVYSKLEKQSFDGIDDYVSVPTTGWNLAGMTIAMWINPSTVSGSRYVFGHTVGTWSNRIQLYIQNGLLGLGLGNTHALNQTIYTCQAGQWYFLVLTWNGSNYQVYVNDQLQAQGTYTGLSQFNTFADIGNTGSPENRTTEPFAGTIDDIRIFSRALSASQEAMIFQYGRNGCLTGHWRLDDYASATTADSSESGYTAALVNAPVWGQSWADEDFILLNTKTQAMQIPSDAIRTQAGTIAAWISPASESGAQYLFGHVYNSANRIALLTINGKLAVSLGSQSLIQQNIDFLPYNQMVHVALAWNNGQYSVHVNGEQKASGTYSGLTGLRSTFDVGNYGDPALRIVGFLGLIDEVRTYSRALAADEIRNLFQTYEVKENRQVAFIVSGVDSQGNPLTYSASNLPEGAVFDRASQSFSWRPWYRQAGEYNLTFNAQGQPSENVTVTVQEVTLQDWYREFLEANGKL